MPLYAYRCETDGEFEVLRSAPSESAACPHCELDGTRLWSTFNVQVDPGEAPAHRYPVKMRGRAHTISDRAGGGGATLVPETGGYRPSLTHRARCPIEGRMRNVAILNKHSRTRFWLNCTCGYQWLHDGATAADPLLDGTQRSLMPEIYGNLYPGERYQQPERTK